MKIRSGFVSNSSSSSFLIVGCNVKKESEETKEKLYKAGFKAVGYYLDEDEGDFMGFISKVSSEDEDAIESYSISKFSDIENKIKTIVPDAKVSVLFGVKYG